MVIANIKSECNNIHVFGLTQWDYGQVLRIQGLNLPKAVEMHFSLSGVGGESITRIGNTKDGVTDVVIPDSMLENNGVIAGYNIFVWVYKRTETSGETMYSIKLNVNARSKPEQFDSPEQDELFKETILAVNDSAERAENAKKVAEEAAKQSEESASNSSEDRKAAENAKNASEKAQKEINELISGWEGIEPTNEFVKKKQEVSNAGKFLGIDISGMVTPENAINGITEVEMQIENTDIGVEEDGRRMCSIFADITDYESGLYLFYFPKEKHMDKKVLIWSIYCGIENGEKGTVIFGIYDMTPKLVDIQKTDSGNQIVYSINIISSAMFSEFIYNKETDTWSNETSRTVNTFTGLLKNQGVQNKGKFLGVNNEGQAVPLELPKNETKKNMMILWEGNLRFEAGATLEFNIPKECYHKNEKTITLLLEYCDVQEDEISRKISGDMQMIQSITFVNSSKDLAYVYNSGISSITNQDINGNYSITLQKVADTRYSTFNLSIGYFQDNSYEGRKINLCCISALIPKEMEEV